MKKNFPSNRLLRPVVLAALVFSGFILPGQAVTVLIDIGQGGGLTTSNGAAPNDPVNFWNNLSNITLGTAAVAGGGPSTNLVSTTNVATGIGLTINGGTALAGSNTGGTLVSTAYAQNASSDSLFYQDGPTATPRLVLTGLDDSGATSYTFTFFASRAGVGDIRSTRYTVTGTNSGFAVLNASNNVNTTVSVAGILPTIGGGATIDLIKDVTNNNASGFGYLGVLQIDTISVPEPSTFTLFGVVGGFLCLVAGRRFRLRA